MATLGDHDTRREIVLMRAVRSTPPGVSVVDVDEPEGDGALIAIRGVGICGSDFEYIHAGSRFILGHELAGTTEDGTPVAVEAIFGCEECDACRAGQYNLCVHGTTMLGGTCDGGMSEYFVVPERAVVPLPAGLDPADASLVETTAIGWHACRLAEVGPQQRVAVVGGGALGLLAAVAARAAGAADVAVSARHPHQREAAQRLGFDAPSGDYDVVLEAAGSESALDQATKLARKGGMVAVMGVFGAETRFPYMRSLMKELRTVSSLGYCSHDDGKDFEAAAKILASDPGIVDTVISHRFPLEDAAEAFRVAADKSSGALKVVIEP